MAEVPDYVTYTIHNGGTSSTNSNCNYYPQGYVTEIKETPVKKKIRKKVKKNGYRRRIVRLSKNVHDILKSEVQVYAETSRQEDMMDCAPFMFLLGETKTHVIKDLVKLSTVEGGCEFMPRIAAAEMAGAYFRLAKRGLIACGLARVASYIEGGTHWGNDDGFAVYTKNMEFILSIDNDNIRAIRPKYSDFLDDEYVEDLDEALYDENLEEIKVTII